MTWLEVRRALELSGTGPAPAGRAAGAGTEADTSGTADVLLQVVLPIVLILAFFVLQSARRFEERLREAREHSDETEDLGAAWREIAAERERLAAEQRRVEELLRQATEAARHAGEEQERLDERAQQVDQEVAELARWWSGVAESEKGELAEELSRALLEIQKQRLVAALEAVEGEYRRELGLAFLEHKEIHLTGEGRLAADHESFLKACRATAQAFQSEASRSREQARLYLRVLDVAGLADDGPPDAGPAVAETRTVRDSLRAQQGRITMENRAFVEQRLAQLLSGLQRELLRLGSRVVAAALDHYRSAPLDDLYRRNPEIVRLKQEIVRASREGRDTAPYEEALLRRLYQQVKTDFDRQGYTLLPEVWRNV